MSRETHIPGYCPHKAKNLAYVRLDGRSIYLGRYGSPSSHDEYSRLIGLWTLNGRRLPPGAVAPVQRRASAIRGIHAGVGTGSGADASVVYTVAHLCRDYLDHMEVCWARHPEKGGTQPNRVKTTLRPLLKLYARDAVEVFGPKKLKLVRESFIQNEEMRTEINKRVRVICKMFKWGVEEERVPDTTWHRLTSLESLKRGEGGQESIPVEPVSRQMIDETLPFLNRFVLAMVEVGYLTGARPEELCLMRASDIDMGGSVWIYTPMKHKMAYRGQERKIPLGPDAQKLLRPLLTGKPGAFLFSPAIADQERRNALEAARTTPVSCGNVRGTNKLRAPRKEPGEHYTPDSLRNAIYDACKKAYPLPPHLAPRVITPTGRKKKPRLETPKEWKARLTPTEIKEVLQWEKDHRWFPYQLRHTAATRFREKGGIEVAQIMLGHRHVKVTEMYAKANFKLAEIAMSEYG